jgi:hypothetical protein
MIDYMTIINILIAVAWVAVIIDALKNGGK